MALNFVQKLGPLRQLILKGWRWDARNKYHRFKHILSKADSHLDIGSGYGTVTELMRQEGFEVQAVDVANQAISEALTPVVYDGETLPFAKDYFHTGMLLTVLHHTPYPERVIAEAARACQRIIIIEDVYRNKPQQYLTWFFDSLFNFEFRGHPHTNKSRAGWEQCCENLGLKLEVIRSDRFLLFFRQETYLVSRSVKK